MPLERTVKKVGGSLCVIIPRDLAEMMGVTLNSPVILTLVGRQLVIEPKGVAKGSKGGRSNSSPRDEELSSKTRRKG